MFSVEGLDSVLPGQGTEYDAVDERILDAALVEFLDFGLRRSTVADITKRAKVGRMTVHRRFPTKQSLVESVFLREIRRLLAEVNDVTTKHEELVDQLVEGFIAGLRFTNAHPLFSRLFQTDREEILPYLTVDAGALMVACTDFVANQIRTAGPRTGKSLSPEYAAETIIRFCHSILLTPHGRIQMLDADQLRPIMTDVIRIVVEGRTA